MTIDQAFNESVNYYDSWMKKALPGYEDLFAVARDLIPFPANALIDVLDLGAGTGLFSRHVLDKYPQGSFVLWDIAAKMLDVARKRFGPSDGGRFRYLLDDYRRIDYAGTFDVVLSSLSIHHLSDEDKRLLFPRIYRALRSPGVFINIDQVRGPTPEMQELYWTTWLKMVRKRGGTEEEIRASVDRRRTYDREALLTDQLAWLEEAGFRNADCVYKNWYVGVFYAEKREAPPARCGAVPR
ncbi:MAG TPA: class I SAM-dependent methyltransferase [Syntrophales bacterium]|nr:class I SAM-dependent methyltransferase [Syntrophales bacterium]